MKDNFNDFFGEELQSKLAKEEQHIHEANSQPTDSDIGNIWASTPPQGQPVTTKHRSITVVLICLALVMVFSLGFVTSQLFSANDEAESLLSEVLDALRNDFYYEISDEEWQAIIANGGTALLQTVDKYGRLLTPQDAYTLFNGTAEATNGTYGVSLNYINGVGYVVSSVVRESNAMGRLFEGDKIIGFKGVMGENGQLITAPDGALCDEVIAGNYSNENLNSILASSYSATFVVLRGSQTIEVHLTRGSVGSKNNVQDGFNYIEYYFGDQLTNISVTTESGRAISSKELLCLDQLPSDIGYLYISQFSTVGSSVAEEFAKAMTKFHDSGLNRLVLDLKGNPGGDVNEITKIASYLATTDFISVDDRNKITNSITGDITVSTLVDNDNRKQEYTVKGNYSNYFADPVDSKRNIIVLTDGGSASASEMLTGILTELNVAEQIGTTTYGKGIAQQIRPITGHSEVISTPDGEINFNWYIYITIAEYLSPLGNNIHGVGYTPSEKYNNITSYAGIMTAVNSYWN